MTLSAPRVPLHVFPNDNLGTVDYYLDGGVPATLSARISLTDAEPAALTGAVRDVIGLLSPAPYDADAARALTRDGLVASFDVDGWLDESAEPTRRGDIYSVAHALAQFDNDSELMVKVMAVAAAMTESDLLPSPLGWGGLSGVLLHPAGADALGLMPTALSDPALEHVMSSERIAWYQLQLASLTGLEQPLSDGLERMQLLHPAWAPSGGLSWRGIPNEATNVGVCVDGIMAALTAWTLTNDPLWLERAQWYAHVGLQYVLATDLPGASGTRYGVTVAIASTDAGRSLLGTVSDAYGVALARAYLALDLADPGSSWGIVAEGIIASAVNRQESLGTGRLVDDYDVRRRTSFGEDRLGHTLAAALLMLQGQSLSPSIDIVTAPDGGKLRIASMSEHTAVSFDTQNWSLQIDLEASGTLPKWIFVGGLSYPPPSVTADLVPLLATDALQQSPAGWDYVSGINGVLIKVPAAAASLHVDFPIPDADADQFPANIDCDDTDPTVFPGQDEVCNGKDDNCVDGIDEPESTGFLECGIGQCAHLEPACVAGVFVDCNPMFGQSDEICDGLDNDCDGETDEEVGTISCGTGQCVHSIYACDACDPFLGASPEVCDDVDNDCDGETDETPGTVFCGLGACAHIISVCEECDPLLGQGEEVCNLIDDDCDGETDEGQPTVFCGTGACLQEITACAPCDPLAGSTAEVCNLIDDDCDGETDEETPTVLCGTGLCERAIPACQVCDPVLGAVPEICNGIDDDCNGVTDDAGGLKPCGTGQCYREIGKCEQCIADLGAFDEVCDGKDNDCDGETDEIIGEAICGLGECAHPVAGCNVCDPLLGATLEVCDGKDNDCDGETDEVSDLGTFECGLGSCLNILPNCTEGSQTTCDAFNGAIPEICDGIDNDCDGVTDEDIASFQCGTGQCEYTVIGCNLSGPDACNPLLGASEEVCDGVDNDCDGDIDESFGTLVCGELLGCPQVVPKCVGGIEQFCHPVTGLAPELCDGVDNDCDSFTDEDQPVITCGQGACLHTVPGCLDGALNICDAFEGATTETCNFIDDDCDGETDESSPPVVCGLGACQRTIDGCLNGAPVPCVPLDVAKPDVCNGIDDDCDGDTDENQGEIICGVGACEVTLPLCVDGVAQACDAQTGQAPELCDGIDNDCDGEIDEGLGTKECGRGLCRRTIAACSNGAPTVCDPFLGLQSEVCDSLDNDCDGETDEGLGNLTCTVGGEVIQVPGCQDGQSVTCSDGILPSSPGSTGQDEPAEDDAIETIPGAAPGGCSSSHRTPYSSPIGISLVLLLLWCLSRARRNHATAKS
ncbi:MAG: putative metal-binding motif-containing protein [Myxococcota bacterium]|nr:putative metal-binding motif-containing protein [Myxococcota bacterium]